MSFTTNASHYGHLSISVLLFVRLRGPCLPVYQSFGHLSACPSITQPSARPWADTHRATPSPRLFIKPSLTPAKGTHWHREPLARLTSLLVPFPCSCSQGPEDHDDPDESPRRRHRADLGTGLPGQHPRPFPLPWGDAMPTDSLVSVPGVGLVAMRCIVVPTLVHPGCFGCTPSLLWA